MIFYDIIIKTLFVNELFCYDLILIQLLFCVIFIYIYIYIYKYIYIYIWNIVSFSHWHIKSIVFHYIPYLIISSKNISHIHLKERIRANKIRIKILNTMLWWILQFKVIWFKNMQYHMYIEYYSHLNKFKNVVVKNKNSIFT